METYGHSEVQRLRVLGLKKLFAKLLALRIVNWFTLPILARMSPQQRVRMPLAYKLVAYEQSAGTISLLNPAVDHVARDIFWGRGRPQNPADARTLRCVELLCAEGGTFYDIGSYSGLFAMVAAKANPSTKAIALEIVPENYLLICRNIIANDLITQITPCLLGLSDAPGAVRIPPTLNLPSLASSMSIGSSFAEGVLVPLTCLDLFATNDEGPYVMKIDVEGFEYEVINGGSEFIRRSRPDIICELLPDAPRVQELEKALSPLGYRFFQSCRDGLEEKAALRPTNGGRDWLFSCRPEIDTLIANLG